MIHISSVIQCDSYKKDMQQVKILIVEDEAIIALDISHTLESIGYAIEGRVATGEEAIEICAGRSPDIVLMDIILSGQMDGIEAALYIMDQFGIPVVYLTANTDRNTFQRAIESQPYGFVLKPAGNYVLYTVIETAIHRFYVEHKLVERENEYRKSLHRSITNNFQMISNLIHLQSKAVTDVNASDALKESRKRINTMAHLHERLYTSNTLSGVELRNYVQQMIRDIEETHGIKASSIDFVINFEEFHMDISIATNCVLIMYELLTNAVKHAFADRDRGNREVILDLVHLADESCILTVSDSGPGFPGDIDPKNPDSLGLRVVNMLVADLNGKMIVDNSHGATFHVFFPLK